MLIDFSQTMSNLDGDDMVDEGTGKPLTLGNICASACATKFPDGLIKNDNALRAGELSMHLYSAGKFGVSARDITMMQNRCEHRWSPNIYFQAHTMLESGEPEPKGKGKK